MRLLEASVGIINATLAYYIYDAGWPEYVEALINSMSIGVKFKDIDSVDVKDNRTRYDFKYEDCLGVIKLFEVPDDAVFALLRWHGFDGVEIDAVFDYKTYASAVDAMWAELDEFVKTLQSESEPYERRDLVDGFVLDTGSEWYGWQIVWLEEEK